MKPILPKAPIQRRKLSITLDQTLLQDVDELAAFLGGATDRAYIVEQALRRIVAEHKAFQQWRSQKDQASVLPVAALESGDTPLRQLLRLCILHQRAQTNAGHLWAQSAWDTKGWDQLLFQAGAALSVWTRGLATTAAAVGHRGACWARETAALDSSHFGFTQSMPPGFVRQAHDACRSCAPTWLSLRVSSHTRRARRS